MLPDEEFRVDVRAFPIAILFDSFDAGADKVLPALRELGLAIGFARIEVVPVDIVTDVLHDEIRDSRDMDKPEDMLEQREHMFNKQLTKNKQRICIMRVILKKFFVDCYMLTGS